jgi:NAD(P)-dependent dehydrogenase (short-subunit alcohol dehydrogenase family)
MTTTVITGSGSGIGAATRAKLESQGHEVIGVDLRGAEIVADLGTPDGRASAVAAILERSGGTIDRMVLAAGIGGHASPGSLVVAINYFGLVELLDGCFEALQKGSAPAAIAMCSNSAKMLPMMEDSPAVAAMLDGDETRAITEIEKLASGDLAYLASKNAVGKAVRRRAQRWGSAGVRLNAVAPGPVMTPLLQGGLDTPGTGDAIRALEIPVGRFGEPSEIAELIAYMLGPDAGFIHGSVFYIDGGCDAQIRPDGY